jgi:hypothetical protein
MPWLGLPSSTRLNPKGDGSMSKKTMKRSESKETVNARQTTRARVGKATRKEAKPARATTKGADRHAKQPATPGQLEAFPLGEERPPGTTNGAGRRIRDERLPAIGTMLIKRDRGGQVRCECTIEEGGFRYRDTLYRSLSGAASAAAADLGIKGRVNGYLFWGVIRAAPPQTNPREHLRKIAARYEEQVAAILRNGSSDDVRGEVRQELEAHAANLSELLARSAA